MYHIQSAARVILLLLVITQKHLNHASVNTLLGNTKESYLQFEPVKISPSGSIRFRFKTTEPDGFLLYADDQNQRGLGNFIRLELQNEKLRIFFQLSTFDHIKEVKNVDNDDGKYSIGDNLNDDRYHYVEVLIESSKLTFKLDSMSRTHMAKLKEGLLLTSHVYIGGTPIKLQIIRSSSLHSFHKRFTGCVGELRYSSTTSNLTSLPLKYAKLIDSKHIIPGCFDRCEAVQTLKCMNRGKCLNMYTKTGCDCRGTGFTGQTCTKHSTSLQFPGYSYMAWRPSNVINPTSNEITLRYKTAKSSGVLLYAVGEREDAQLLLELYQKSLILVTKILGYKEEVIKLSDHNINDTSWRFVKILINNRKIHLHLSDGLTERTYLQQDFYSKEKFVPNSSFRFKEFFIGGRSNVKSIRKSKGKAHFIGCMQDVVVNQVDLIEEFRREQITKENTIQIGGSVKEGCNKDIFTETDFHKVIPVDYSSLSTSISLEKNTKKSKDLVDNTNMWIIVSVCIVIVFVTFIVVIVMHVRRKRLEKAARKYSDHYLRQTAMPLHEDDSLPTEQKCIREEIAKRRLLKTFSPVRKEFYVCPSDASLQRTMTEPIYQSHDVLHHNHPYIGHNFINPMASRHQTPQQHPSSLHNVNNYTSSPFHHHMPPNVGPLRRGESPNNSYVCSNERKCSHGSRYQVPTMIRHDSLKSSISQQSSFFDQRSNSQTEN